jgi:hypothetical protein
VDWDTDTDTETDKSTAARLASAVKCCAAALVTILGRTARSVSRRADKSQATCITTPRRGKTSARSCGTTSERASSSIPKLSAATTFLRNDWSNPCALRHARSHYTNRPTPCTRTCTRTSGYACAWYTPRPIRAAQMPICHATSSGCARARPLIASAPLVVAHDRAHVCWSDSRSASVRLASLRPTSMYTSPRCSCGGLSASELSRS